MIASAANNHDVANLEIEYQFAVNLFSFLKIN